MELVLIRHLATEYNQKGILQGTRDIPVLEPATADILQIKNNKQLLLKYKTFDTILASEYKRTIKTAEYYGYDKEIQVEKLLNELNFGSYEGRTRAELISDHGELWLHKPQLLILGEPLIQLADRVLKFIYQYQDKHHVLVFGHGSWMRAVYSICEHGNIDKMNQLTINNNEILQLSINPNKLNRAYDGNNC